MVTVILRSIDAYVAKTRKHKKPQMDNDESTTGVGQLDWDSIELVGRKEEAAQLHKTLAASKDAPASVVLIRGPSGIGKSAFINCVRTASSTKAIWLTGKYEQYDEGTKQLGAVADAIGQLCEFLGTKPTLRTTIQQTLQPDEIGLMSDVVPALKSIMPDDASEHHVVNVHSHKSFSRLFRVLLSTICQEFMLVLMLDDLQWADDVSRELLNSLLASRDLQNLVLLGCIRTGDDSEDFKFDTNCGITPAIFNFLPLEEENVNQMISSILGMETEETASLAQLAYTRSMGNPYFVVQFIESLIQNNLLQLTVSMKYSWDVKAIAARTKPESSVVDLLVAKIASMKRDVKVALVLAAHIGFSFQIHVVEVALGSIEIVSLFPNTFGQDENKATKTSRGVYCDVDLRLALLRAVKAGLVISSENSDSCYTFSHDRVQQSAASLLPEGKTGKEILANLGKIVYGLKGNDVSNDWRLFTAAKLLYRNNYTMSEKEVAAICYEAAAAAKARNAFPLSAKYADWALKKIKQIGWEDNYDGWLEACSLSAEMNYCAGRLDVSKKRTKEIFKNAKSREDKIRAFSVALDTLWAEGDWNKCIKEGRRIVSDLGTNMPKNAGTLSVGLTLAKTRMLLRGRNPEDLKDLAETRDKVTVSTCAFLGLIAEAAYFAGKDTQCAHVSLMIFNHVLRFGISDQGVYSYCGFANCLIHLGYVKEATEYFTLAYETVQRKGMETPKIISAVALHFLGHHLMHTLTEVVVELDESFGLARRQGDIRRASFICRAGANFKMVLGANLCRLRELLNFALQFSRDYQQKNAEMALLPLAQMVECLTGETQHCDVLAGDYMDEVKDLKDNDQEDRFYLRSTYVFRVFMLSILGMHDTILEVHRTYEKLKLTTEATVSSIQNVITLFHLAMTHLGLARRLTSKEHRHAAKPYVKELRKLAVVGSPLICTMLVLIEAERAALEQNVQQALDLYQQAIEDFGAQKLLWYKLMSLERAGNFCLSRADIDSGRSYLLTAYNEYELMGVKSKLTKLREDYRDLDFDSNEESAR